MTVDNCPYSFDEIVSKYIPEYFRKLGLTKPISKDVFICAGKGIKGTLKELGHMHDFKGCYVFLESGKPMYVGISKNVIRRLSNHFKAKHHFESSLVYKVACLEKHIQKHKSKHKGAAYTRHFKKALARVRTWEVIYQEISDDITLYLFEVYAAMHFETGWLNSFKTH